jgi:two-component SAPR family response regulator
MPKMNGYELYDKIKNIDDRVKVCFITAAFMDYEKGKDACVILKPVELTNLIEIVKAKVS